MALPYAKFHKDVSHQDYIKGHSRSSTMTLQDRFKCIDVHLKDEQNEYDVEVTLEELFQGFTAIVKVHPLTLGFAHLSPEEVVNVPPGSIDGDCFELKTFPGNFIQLKQTPHQYYNRHGDHLFLSMKIEFHEALAGFQKKIQTLDGTKIIVSPAPGEVIHDGDIKCVRYKGMPNKNNDKGHLYIRFTVDIPTSLDERVAYQLAMILLQSQINASTDKTRVYRKVELQEYNGD